MTFTTHKEFSIYWAYVGTMMLYVMGMTEINYYLSLIIVVQMAKYGSRFPDIDHHWNNVKDKNVSSWIINKFIHITGGYHRSWQTHSIDIAAGVAFLSYFLPKKLYSLRYITAVNREVLNVIMIGFSLGWLSHIVADMLTSEGVRLTFIRNFKVKLVPKKIFSLRFNTGNEWESFVYKVTKMFNILMGAVTIAFPFLYGRIGLDMLEEILTKIK